MREVKLFWEGLWDITEKKAPLNVPESGGILMLLDARFTPNKVGFDTTSYRLIELCESSNMYGTLMNSSRFQNWKAQSDNRLLLKISKIDSAADRAEIIRLLTDDPEAPSDVILSNAGYKLPLKAYYSVPIRESAA
jgi:hypothetical protein